MHFLEQYALSSGLKIGKPYIYEAFFPITSQKYICFHPAGKYDSRNYDYWQLVIDLILPTLKKNGIDIIQIGGKNEKAYANCIHAQGNASINQTAYIINKSILSFGADSFSVHVASGFDKKIVALYSNNNVNNCGPYWSNPESVALLESKKANKPSFSVVENPKTINNIKPEIIANSILKLLGLGECVKIKTLFIGDNFNDQINFGFLPDQIVVSEKNLPEFRMDLMFDEKNLPSQLSKQRSILVTNKPISQEILMKFKANVAKVIYLVEENDNPEFVKFLFENGFGFDCVSTLPTEKLDKKKINYYRFCNIKTHLETEKEKEFKNSLKNNLSEKVKFKTNYIICSNRKNYLSEEHLASEEPIENIDGFHPIKDTEQFFRDVKNSWFIEELY